MSDFIIGKEEENMHRKLTSYWMLILLFPLSCIFDIYNGYTNLFYDRSATISLLYKGILFILCILYSINRKKSLFFIFIYLILYLSCFLYWQVSDTFKGTFVEETNSFLKISYPYAVLLYIYSYSREIKERILVNNIIAYGIIAVITIIITFILGIGVNSYGGETAYQFGTKGFFTAGNDIGLSILLSNCIACYAILNKFSSVKLSIVVLLSVGGVMIGSIAGIGGTFVVIFCLFYYIFINGNQVMSANHRLFLILFLIVLVFIGIFEFVDIMLSDDYFVSRIDSMLAGNSRGSLEESAKNLIEDFGIGSWLFGNSAGGFRRMMASQLHDAGSVLTEMDFYDLIGYYGIIFGGSLIGLSFYFFYVSIRIYLKCKSALMYWISISLALFIGHGFFAGHAYTSPTVSLLYVGIVGLVIKVICEKRMHSRLCNDYPIILFN